MSDSESNQATRQAEQWLSHLVADWGGFEKLIAQLNDTGLVTVEHNVTLVGRSGAPRQIDVLVRHKEGLYEHKTIIECKYWKSRVSRLHVDALATTVRELNASRGVIFSVVGFESGAITQAQHDGIELFKIREPTDEEWGLPGRHIDFFITYITQSTANFSLPGLYMLGSPDLTLNLEIGDTPDSSTKTATQPIDGFPESTLESVVFATMLKAAGQLWTPEVLFNGKEGERRFWRSARANFGQPIVLVRPRGGIIFIPEIAFDIGIKIRQTRFQLDRGEKFSFVLAVEDCIRGITTTATKERDARITVLLETENKEAGQTGTLQNGSIMTIQLASFFPFSEVSELNKGEFCDAISFEKMT